MGLVLGSASWFTTADRLWAIGFLALIIGGWIWFSRRGGGGITRNSGTGMYADSSWAGRAAGLFGTRVRGGQGRSADMVASDGHWGQDEWDAYADIRSSAGGRRVPGWATPALMGLIILGVIGWFVFIVH